MVAWKKIMGEFEVGHWMGAQKKKEEWGMLEKKCLNFRKMAAKKTIGKIK